MLDKSKHQRFLQALGLVLLLGLLPAVGALLTMFWISTLTAAICLYVGWSFNLSWFGVFIHHNAPPPLIVFLFILFLTVITDAYVFPTKLQLTIMEACLDAYPTFFNYITK